MRLRCLSRRSKVDLPAEAAHTSTPTTRRSVAAKLVVALRQSDRARRAARPLQDGEGC